MPGVRRVMDAYRASLEAGDAEGVASHYDVPLSVIRPERTIWIEDRALLVTELGKIIDFYRWAGMATIEMTHFEEVGFMDGLGIVNVTWLPRDRAGEMLTGVDTTFLMRPRDGRPVIAAVIAHNEESRRMPLVRGDAR